VRRLGGQRTQWACDHVRARESAKAEVDNREPDSGTVGARLDTADDCPDSLCLSSINSWHRTRSSSWHRVLVDMMFSHDIFEP